MVIYISTGTSKWWCGKKCNSSLSLQYPFHKFKVCTWKIDFGNSRSAGNLIFSAISWMSNLWKVQPHICQPSRCPKGITWFMQRTRKVIEPVFNFKHILQLCWSITTLWHRYDEWRPKIVVVKCLTLFWWRDLNWSSVKLCFYRQKWQVLSEQLQTELSCELRIESFVR